MGHMFSGSSSYSDLYNPYFEGTCMVNQIYPPESHLNGANALDAEASFLDSHLSIDNGFVSSNNFDKRNEFYSDFVNLPFLGGIVSRRTSYGL